MPRSPFTKTEFDEFFQNIVLNALELRAADFTFRQLPDEIVTHYEGSKTATRTLFHYFDVKIQGCNPSLFENKFEKLNEIRSEIRGYLKVKEGRIVKIVGTPDKRFIYIKVEFKSDVEVLNDV